MTVRSATTKKAVTDVIVGHSLFNPTHIQVNQQREKARLQICEKRASYFQIFMICNFAAKLFQLLRPQDF